MDQNAADVSSSESYDFTGDIIPIRHVTRPRLHQRVHASAHFQEPERPTVVGPRISTTKEGSRVVMHVKTFKSTADALRYLQSRENTAFRERSQFRRTTVLGCASHVDCKAQARVTEPDDKTYTLSTSGYHTLHLVPSTPDSSDNGQHCFSSSESESSSSEADNYLGICESEVDPAVVDADINDENGADDINSDEAVMREFGISSCSNDEFDIGDSSFGSAAEESSDDSDEAANTCITDAQMNDANEDDVRVLGPFKTRELARVAIDRFTNIRYKRHNNNRDTVWYKCSTHTNCSATAKIKLTASNKMYTATLIGIHSDVEAPLSDQRTGIHKPLEDEVNNLLLGGQGPARCLTTLEMKYRNDEDMLRLLPDVTQLKNRSQLLHSRGDYNISSMADIMKWAAPKMCKSKEVFFKEEENAYQVVGDPKTFAKTPFNYRHELLVLDIFTEPVGKKDVSYGIIFTTRKLFRNAALAALGQREGVLAVTDGTYKIDFNNWTLISFGTCGVRYTTKKQYQHKFYPIAFLFVRAETTLAYNKLFTVVKNFTSDFFGGDLNVKFGSMDHSAAIASAFRNIWPDIELLDCWPHLDRKSRGKEGLLSDTQVYKDIIKPQLDQLETARSCEQLFALSELVSQNWREQKQGAYANWFDEQYLTDPWDLWFITASNVAGIVPNQNPIEAHHSAIKKVAAGHLRAAISHVLAVTLPKILIHCGRDKNTEFLWPFASGPVDEKVFQAAKLLSKSGNYYPSHERMSKREITKIDRYFFNSDYYLIHDGNLYGQKVTHARTSLYAKSLEGVLKKDEVVNNIQLAYQSLHAVDILTRESIEHDWASPIWTIEEIRDIRSKFKCDCKEFYQTGWLCGHVIACLKLVDGLDFSLMLRGLLVRRPSGRPRKKKQCLEREGTSLGQYSVDALISRLIKTPASVINWSVLNTWPTTNRDGEIEDRDFVGIVEPPFMKGGARYWDVYFEKRDETVTMAAEQLAITINYAHRMGHHIVPARTENA